MAWQDPAPSQSVETVGRSGLLPEKRESPAGAFRLSYSGMTDLFRCEQKFHYGRIQRIPVDADVEESHALQFGSAFHAICEATRHRSVAGVPLLIQEAVQAYNLPQRDGHKLAACLKAYYNLHESSGLRVVACEVELYYEGFYLGYIDAVLTAEDGGWWIGDLKTASSAQSTTFKRLERDMQLNMYASYKDDVAARLGLDPRKFQGCVYLVTIKPKIEPRAGESLKEYISRACVRSYAIYVRSENLHVEETRAIFQAAFDRASDLVSGRTPIKNYASCADWMRPCEYWSQCHGALYSETPVENLHESEMGKRAPESIINIPDDDFWSF